YRKNEDWYSQPLGFLHYLVNWEDADVRLPRMPIRDYLGRNRPIFGNEAMEMRGWTRSQVGALLSAKEYPDMTDCDMLDRFRSLLLGAAAGEFSVRGAQAPHLDHEPRGVCEPAQRLARQTARQLVGQGDHCPGDGEQDAVLPEFPFRERAVSARPRARGRADRQ